MALLATSKERLGNLDEAFEIARAAVDGSRKGRFRTYIHPWLSLLDISIKKKDADTARDIRKALSNREGALLPLVSDFNQAESFRLERHVCVDTTASGGNAALLAAQ